MRISRPFAVLCSTLLLVAGFAAGTAFGARAAARAPRVFELRTYTAPEGKLGELHARFQDHTLRMFQKHGMTSVGYWKPLDAPLSGNTMVYLLAYPSRDAAKASWASFREDAEWKNVAAQSQLNGPLVAKVDSVFLEPAGYSPMQ